jgi:hypothetical protein
MDPIETECNRCLAAVNILHFSSHASEQQNANNCLTDFQQQPIAWHVCDRILHRPNLDGKAYHFAANTLRQKILGSFHEINSLEARLSFRDSIFRHVIHFKEDRLIGRTLAICLADVAVLMTGSNEWGTALSDFITQLRQHGHLLLLILTSIPEECTNHRLQISDEHRNNAVSVFSRGSSQTLALLEEYYQISNNDVSLIMLVMECFLAWVKQGVSPAELASSPLVARVFDTLQAKPLFKVSCQTICELIRQTEKCGEYEAAIIVILPRVIKLLPLFEEVVKRGRSDDEIALPFSRIFVDAAETYLLWLGERKYQQQWQQVMHGLMLATGHPNKEVSMYTFRLWNNIASELTSDEGIPQQQQAMIVEYRPFFMNVVRCIQQIMCYPPEYERVC